MTLRKAAALLALLVLVLVAGWLVLPSIHPALPVVGLLFVLAAVAGFVDAR